MGSNPNWDIDLAFGEAGENRLAHLLGLNASRVEVKTDRLFVDTNRVFIELYQRPWDSTRWKPSGLMMTEADFWAFNLGAAAVIVPTDTLRQIAALRTASGTELTIAAPDSENPTKGYPLHILEILTTAARWSA